MICVKDIAGLDIFKNIELLGGKNGLTRRVTWPNIIQSENVSDWLIGGDVIIVSGIGISCTVETLNRLISQAARQNAACMIVLRNELYFKEINPENIAFAEINDFPLFMAPWSTKLCLLMKAVATLYLDDQRSEENQNDFMVNLLQNTLKQTDMKVAEKMKDYGLHGFMRVITVRFKNSGKNLTDAEYVEYIVHWKIGTLMKELFTYYYFIRIYEDVVFLVEGSCSSREIREKCRIILERLQECIQVGDVIIGVGQAYEDPTDYHKSYEETILMLKIQSDNPVRLVEDTGILRLLIEADKTKNLKEYANNVLFPLRKFDEKHYLELEHTLHTLLMCDMNITRCAQVLYIHKNTLLKRTARIEEILGVSLKDVETKNNLYNCCKILELF